jgi:hypothetical protein
MGKTEGRKRFNHRWVLFSFTSYQLFSALRKIYVVYDDAKFLLNFLTSNTIVILHFLVFPYKLKIFLNQ